MKFILAICAFFAPAAALAADNVSLDSSVFVERHVQDSSGASKSVLEEPKIVTPGDRLVFVLSYQNKGPNAATAFIITNPIPESVVFTGAEGEAEVSVDGAKSWGQLASLKVNAADGTVRNAEAADVTHVRWAFAKAIPAGQAGKLSFRGVVK